jgi:predicted nucleic acid-binding protein
VTLVDTSIWIDHFRRNDSILVRLLEDQQILMHPFVIGELALGILKQRSRVLHDLLNIASAAKASDEEVLVLIERHQFAGSGLGYIDAHLLASASISGASLWTRDKRLQKTAASLGLAWVH